MQMLVTVHELNDAVFETRVNKLLQQGYRVSSTSCECHEYRAVLVMDVEDKRVEAIRKLKAARDAVMGILNG